MKFCGRVCYARVHVYRNLGCLRLEEPVNNLLQLILNKLKVGAFGEIKFIFILPSSASNSSTIHFSKSLESYFARR